MKKLSICFILLFTCFSAIYGQEVVISNHQPYRYKYIYKDCANELSVYVSNYKPEEISFEAENAEIQIGQRKGDIIIVPKNPRSISLSLKIFHKDTLLKKVPIIVVGSSPTPSLHILIGKEQKEHLLGKDIAKEQFTEISFQARLSPNEALDIPHDCQYQVSHVELFLARDGELIGESIVSISGKADLRQMMANAKQGDRLVAYIMRVERLNYKGEWQEELLYRNERIITIGIK